MPDWLDPEVPTLARSLQQAGYVTGLFGKWHLSRGTTAPSVGAYGFDEWHTYYAPYERPELSLRVVDDAVTFVWRHRDRPFFVCVWLFDPHQPLEPTPEQLAFYADESDAGRRAYHAVVTDMDMQIGRLLDELEAAVLTDDTLVLFTSDNGPEDPKVAAAYGIPEDRRYSGSTAMLRGRKRSLYEGGVRVPLIARWPGKIPRGRIDKASALSTVDLFPTLAALAGGNRPSGLDGEDMSDVLLGRSRDRATPLLWEWRFRIIGPPSNNSPAGAIRRGVWKLLADPSLQRVELYNLEQDPRESRNLFSSSCAIVPIVSQLIAELGAWQASLPDPLVPATEHSWLALDTCGG
jgi:N-acetylgalactosamine-6-sulfatase